MNIFKTFLTLIFIFSLANITAAEHRLGLFQIDLPNGQINYNLSNFGAVEDIKNRLAEDIGVKDPSKILFDKTTRPLTSYDDSLSIEEFYNDAKRYPQMIVITPRGNYIAKII